MLKPMRLYLVNGLVRLIPATRLYPLKRRLFQWAGVSLGDNVRLVSSVKIIGSGELSIGANTFVGHNTLILLGGKRIDIGADGDISSNVTIVNGTHHIASKGVKAAGTGYAVDMTIGDGVWLGASVTVIAGANIGAGSLIAAGALVNSPIESMSIAAGVPCKVMKARHG